jgi:serine/threonine-protein kinase
MSSSSFRTIGGHRLVAGLGKGGMARVYLAVAQNKEFGFTKLVVLKVLRDELDENGEFLEMFLQEARLSARLNHPNVVQTYEVGEDGGQHYIAMEYLEGQALSSVVAPKDRDRLALDVHLRVLCDALEGLHYAHELVDYDGTPLGVVHRDISPQNVFVTYTGQAKILDFGIARTSHSARTANGVLKGKAGYMAPEQVVVGADTDRRTDVFAVGVMLWEALAGRRFVDRTVEDVVALTRRVAGSEPRIRRVAPEVPPELADICDKAMATAPADRYATAAEMRDAIEAYLRKGPPVDARRVAATLEAVFAEERSRIRRLVDNQVKEAAHSGPMMDLYTGVTVTPARLGSSTDEAKETQVLALTGDTPPSARNASASRRMFPTLPVALGALLFATAIVVGIRYNRPGPAARASAPAPEPVSPLPLTASSTIKGEPAPDMPVTYELRLTSEPPGARVYEGDAMLGRTPIDLAMDNGALRAASRRLLVRVDGFEPYRVDAVPSHNDVSTHVVLVRAPKTQANNPTSGAKPVPSAAANPASASAEPDRVVAPPDGKGLRPLDDMNPWEKK